MNPIRFDPDRAALLVVDMQEAVLVDTPSAFEVAATLTRLNLVAQVMRKRGRPVVYIQHDDPDGMWRKDGAGWPLIGVLDRQPGDPVVRKTSCDAFRATGLVDVLASSRAESLLIGGYATEFCIDTTVRSAAARGYHAVVLADGHTTRNRPHLDASAIIAHHNWVWAGIANPGAEIGVDLTGDILGRLSI